LHATNEKLRHRTNRIVREATGLDRAAADSLLLRCDRELKTALVSQLAGITPDEARNRLRLANGRVRAAVGRNGHAATLNGAEDLVLGFDGGGTCTVALLASRRSDGGWKVLGRGESGPSNRQVVGTAAALEALDRAAENAFAAADRPRRPVQTACLGLAGAGRPKDQELIREWAARVHLAAKVDVIEDTALLLAAGTPDGCGVAIVAGTGSMAFARGTDGRTARAGGWGPLLGDEGSAYALAIAGLRAATRSADGRAPATMLTDRLLRACGLSRPEDLVGIVYQGGDRPTLAALAPAIIETADDGDSTANGIVIAGAGELAAAAAAAARQVGLTSPLPIAMAGGLLASCPTYRTRFLESLANRGIMADPIAIVTEPAEGAVRLALAGTTTLSSSLSGK
jgi:N-acetylmuramic acid 6-phosphate etherase